MLNVALAAPPFVETALGETEQLEAAGAPEHASVTADGNAPATAFTVTAYCAVCPDPIVLLAGETVIAKSTPVPLSAEV